MKAYEFKTKINKGIVEIPNNYLRELEKCQNVKVIILAPEESETQILPNSHKKLSELLLLPELEENELLFERDKDTVRDILL